MRQESKRQELDRAIRWVIIPVLALSILSLVIFRGEFQQAGLIAVSFSALSWMVFSSKKYEKYAVGIKSNGNITMILWGVGIALGFILIKSVVPAFSLAFPQLSLAIDEDIRSGMVIFLFPAVETLFIVVSIFAVTKTHYKIPNITAIIIVGLMATLLHLLAYGIDLTAFPSFFDAFSSIGPQIGLFISVFIIFSFWAWLITLDGFKTIIAVFVSHAIINWILWFKLTVAF